MVHFPANDIRNLKKSKSGFGICWSCLFVEQIEGLLTERGCILSVSHNEYGPLNLIWSTVKRKLLGIAIVINVSQTVMRNMNYC